MNGKEEMLHALRNLSLDRTAVRLMGEEISRLEEDEKQKELPADQREALDKERGRLSACLTVTVHCSHFLRQRSGRSWSRPWWIPARVLSRPWRRSIVVMPPASTVSGREPSVN